MDMDTEPWYRQFWPWVLIGLPGSVVVAGLTTVWIAVQNADSLVVDDYYKDGLAINQQLDKQERARALGLSAVLTYRAGAMDVALSSAAAEDPRRLPDDETQPAALALSFFHPLDASRDRQLTLPRIDAQNYRARFELPSGSRWHWQIEPLGAGTEPTWRLQGEWDFRDADATAD